MRIAGPIWRATTNWSMWGSFTNSLFSTGLWKTTRIQTLVVNASIIVWTLCIMFTFSSFNWNLVNFTSYKFFGFESYVRSIISRKQEMVLTFATLPIWVAIKTRRTFTCGFMVSSGTYGRWAAWLIICTRIYTTPVSTCLVCSTFGIRWAADRLWLNY